MSGAHRLAAGELSIGPNEKLKGKAYLDMVEEEMNEVDEGSKTDLEEDKSEGEIPTVKNLGK